MIVKNLTTGKEWDDLELDDVKNNLWTGWGYARYFFWAGNLKVGDIILVHGWFYSADDPIDYHSGNSTYVHCHRINPLDACEILERQRSLK